MILQTRGGDEIKFSRPVPRPVLSPRPVPKSRQMIFRPFREARAGDEKDINPQAYPQKEVKMKRVFGAITIALITLTFHSLVYGTETGTMICKEGIISIGDSAGEVISKCGQPATSTQREDKRIVMRSKNRRDGIITATSIDDWLFNFGPNQFQYQLLLENGRVARIESLEYGY